MAAMRRDATVQGGRERGRERGRGRERLERARDGEQMGGTRSEAGGDKGMRSERGASEQRWGLRSF